MVISERLEPGFYHENLDGDEFEHWEGQVPVDILGYKEYKDGTTLAISDNRVWKKMSDESPRRFEKLASDTSAEGKAETTEDLAGFRGDYVATPRVFSRKGDEVEMERVRGECLFSEWLDSDYSSHLPEKMGRAFRELHQNGISFRDIGQSDVILGEEGLVYVVDMEYGTDQAGIRDRLRERFEIWNNYGHRFYRDFLNGYSDYDFRGWNIVSGILEDN